MKTAVFVFTVMSALSASIGAQAALSNPFTCSFFYRPNVSTGFTPQHKGSVAFTYSGNRFANQGPLLPMTEQGTEADLGPFSVSVTVQDDPYESKSFTVSIGLKDGNRGLSSTLYQGVLGVTNVFQSQGFTGLHYLTDPTAKVTSVGGPDLQWFCTRN